MHGLATVLRQTIMSLYPDVNARIRGAYHKEIIPRVCDSSKPNMPCIIMWTRASPRPLDHTWQPNHFVPCTLSVSNEVVSNATIVSMNKSQQDVAGRCSKKVESIQLYLMSTYLNITADQCPIVLVLLEV